METTANHQAAMALLAAAGGFATGDKLASSSTPEKVQTRGNPAQTKYAQPSAAAARETMKYVAPPTPTYAPAGWASIGAVIIPNTSRVQRRGS